jgi:RND family efflux transporter MFP subunit
MDTNNSEPEQPAIKKEPHKIAATEQKIKRLAVGVAAVLAAGFIIVSVDRLIHERALKNSTLQTVSAPLAVEVITVKNAPSSAPLILPGETYAWFKSTIYARVDGYVGKWYSDIGDHVKKGQVLATIETPDLDAQLAAAQAKLKSAEALVEFAKSTYERWKNSPHGVVSEQEREAKKADYESAVAQVGLDQADVNRYTALTRFKQVTAPFDGTITQRRIDIGNLVTAGSTSNTTTLYQMVQDNPMRIFVDVPQDAAGYMKAGVPARVTADNIPDRVFDGKITRTADAIDPETRTLKVEIDVPNDDNALVPGLYVNVTFEVPTTGLARVPAAGLVFRSSGLEVAVVDHSDKVAFRKVTIARDNGNTVDLSSGVSAGDKLVLNINSQIAAGATVQVHEIDDGTANAPAAKQ